MGDIINKNTAFSFTADNKILITDQIFATKFSNISRIIYGAIYNQLAATDPRNIASPGWHVPTDAEWTTLQTFFGGGAAAGGHLKESGLTHWMTPNTGADNSSGFTARASGYRSGSNGQFSGILQYLYAWASTSYNGNGYRAYLNYNSTFFGTNGLDIKTQGNAIRLIKDDSIDPGFYTGNDGTIYKTVKIGNQVWLSESLAETKFRDGSLIDIEPDPLLWSAAASSKMCYISNDINNSIIKNAKPCKFSIRGIYCDLTDRLTGITTTANFTNKIVSIFFDDDINPRVIALNEQVDAIDQMFTLEIEFTAGFQHLLTPALYSNISFKVDYQYFDCVAQTEIVNADTNTITTPQVYTDPDPAIFCPTNGYELPPDPAVFCPVNGYVANVPIIKNIKTLIFDTMTIEDFKRVAGQRMNIEPNRLRIDQRVINYSHLTADGLKTVNLVKMPENTCAYIKDIVGVISEQGAPTIKIISQFNDSDNGTDHDFTVWQTIDESVFQTSNMFAERIEVLGNVSFQAVVYYAERLI